MPTTEVITKSAAVAQKTKLLFSSHINAPVQYGSGVVTLVGYLHGSQYLPYNRLKELHLDCYRIDLNQGSIDNLIPRFAQKAAHVYSKLKNAVSASVVIGCEETGAKVDGNKHWVWTYQTEEPTLLAKSESHGSRQ